MRNLAPENDRLSTSRSEIGDKRSQTKPAKTSSKTMKKLSPKAIFLGVIVTFSLSFGSILADMFASANPASATNFELLLMARKRNNPWISTNDTGHAWLSLIRNDGWGWRTDQTFGFWPGRPANQGLQPDNGADRNNTDRYLRGDYSFAPRGLAVRKIRLSPQQAFGIRTLLTNNRNVFIRTSCLFYSPSSFLSTGICNCLDFSSRAWVNLTGDWRSSMVLNATPDQFVDRINWANRQTGDFVR